jgi:hypothetical protein
MSKPNANHVFHKTDEKIAKLILQMQLGTTTGNSSSFGSYPQLRFYSATATIKFWLHIYSFL